MHSSCSAIHPGRQPGLDPTAQGLHHKCFSGDKLGVAFLECLFFNEDKQVIGPDLVFTGPLPDHRQNDEPLYICVFRAISRPFPILRWDRTFPFVHLSAHRRQRRSRSTEMVQRVCCFHRWDASAPPGILSRNAPESSTRISRWQT